MHVQVKVAMEVNGGDRLDTKKENTTGLNRPYRGFKCVALHEQFPLLFGVVVGGSWIDPSHRPLPSSDPRLIEWKVVEEVEIRTPDPRLSIGDSISYLKTLREDD